jgi:two-component system phosphate regulon sensor histidine kinase PhoR
MDPAPQNRAPSQRSDRPRRRDIALTVGLGVAVMAVLAFSGELSLAAFLSGSLAFAALGVVYYMTALTAAEPSPAPPVAQARRDAGPDTSASMLERLPIPVLLIGPGGRIERANPAARAFLGLGAERGLLSTVLRQPRVLEAVSAALRGERGATVEYSTIAPLESHVRAFIEPIRLDMPGPMPFRAMIVLADDTSSKRAERMRADFLANASHELRTPLASLAGFIETLNGPAKDDEEARERFLGIMQIQTDRMRRLINDLLSLSRVEMNEHVPPTGSVDLNLLVREVTESLAPVAQSRSIRFKIELADEAATVRGDRDQLFEVIENLAGNALKYSSDGQEVCVCVYQGRSRDAAEQSSTRLAAESGRLTLASPALDPDQRYGVVRVRDAGAGIERRYLPRLAERFFRVDGQKSGPKSGTGLGLAIVKHIVNRHRGGFAVESAPGQGSVFSVFFPVAAGQAEAKPVTASELAEADEA